jgi:hypothetical protein
MSFAASQQNWLPIGSYGSNARITAPQHFCPLHPNKQTRQDGLNAACTAAKIASLDHRRHVRAAWAVRHHEHHLSQHLGELTIRVAINRNAEALHDAANLAK